MIFPRETKTLIDGCICIVDREGEPITSGRYKHIIFDGERWGAHRLSFHLNISPIPAYPPSNKEGLALHTCDNKWCVKPEHIYVGTQSQNIRDLFERNPEYREKHKLINVGRSRPQTEETKIKIGLSNKGQRRTEEQKAKMSESQTGRRHPESVKLKISEAFRIRREQSA